MEGEGEEEEENKKENEQEKVKKTEEEVEKGKEGGGRRGERGGEEEGKTAANQGQGSNGADGRRQVDIAMVLCAKSVAQLRLEVSTTSVSPLFTTSL